VRNGQHLNYKELAMPGSLTEEQITSQLSDIWRCREMGEDVSEDILHLERAVQFPDLGAYLTETLFEGEYTIADVAHRLAIYEPARQTLNREQLIDITQHLIDQDGDPGELEQWCELLQANVAHPDVMSLIYWPPHDQELTSAEIVDLASNYREDPA
jgi:hypothetical protein